jgi:hypothetical protein
MNNYILRTTIGLTLLVTAGSVLAAPMLLNSDRAQYEVKVQCKADKSAVDDFIEGNGLLELDTGPCKIRLGTIEVLVRDGETAEIRNGKLALQ